MKKVIVAATLALSLLIPAQAKANPSDEVIIGGAIALGIAGIIAAQAHRNRDRERHHHHYYTPPPRHYHNHPPRLIYRERPYYDHRPYHHHWR